MQNKIIISSDFESIKAEFAGKNVRIFEYENMLLDDAKSVIAEAYIAEYEQKNIVIMAKKLGAEVQNSLLKILEEPPKNIVFTLIVPSKNTLLPTVRSRLMLEVKSRAKGRCEHGLDLWRIDLKSLGEFVKAQRELKENGKLSALELSKLVGDIICDALDSGFVFSTDELEYFKKLSYISALNTAPEYVLTPLLLLLMKKSKR